MKSLNKIQDSNLINCTNVLKIPYGMNLLLVVDYYF